MLSRLGTFLNFVAIQFRLVEQFEGEDRVRVLAAGGQGATQPPLPLTYKLGYTQGFVQVAENKYIQQWKINFTDQLINQLH